MPERFASQFNVKGVTFSMRDHLMMIDVENEHAKVTITTHGASVLSYVPKGEHEDVLWVSPTAVFNGKKAVRGGIPICWPWFGKANSAGLPAHGFVRNMVWHLDHVANLPYGVTEVVLTCSDTEETRALWPHAFHLQLKIEVGEKLALTLTTTNPNDHDIEITEALHTYFNVADPRDMLITGLENTIHLDKLSEDVPPEIQAEPVVLNPPKDSVFLDHIGDAVIEDSGNHRRILIEKKNSSSSVVWNPGPEIVKGFDDIPDDGWLTFACVESGNVLDNQVVVPSEGKHSLTMMLSAEAVRSRPGLFRVK
ncbi:D-hexose-6-phosphate mutarotase [Thiomicrorhabdus sp. ZW0627]|uniref:D-hexose-6-phosphate mutarotase n=1 Tax=Thiomicrorhabdus sp. ZW0627 TaxID=3039774 RepID=UPI0024371C32|nr:D-hexose-6-phosphate mutarotase [Thiomicrorhabdus sp. ZW0627]MDG6774310.1 D-hexose-6-phosphate mutarotase [Thiomicrorhabdus sp. ZW0627]